MALDENKQVKLDVAFKIFSITFVPVFKQLKHQLDNILQDITFNACRKGVSFLPLTSF